MQPTPPHSRFHTLRNLFIRTLYVGFVSALALGAIVFIRNVFAGMPEGMAALTLKASGVGGLSGLVASVSFSLFRRLNRFGAVLSGFVTISCYMSCFSIIFKSRIDTSALFWACNVFYGIAVGLMIFWPVHQALLHRRELQQPDDEVASSDADEHD